jgi:hypothetical protein
MESAVFFEAQLHPTTQASFSSSTLVPQGQYIENEVGHSSTSSISACRSNHRGNGEGKRSHGSIRSFSSIEIVTRTLFSLTRTGKLVHPKDQAS